MRALAQASRIKVVAGYPQALHWRIGFGGADRAADSPFDQGVTIGKALRATGSPAAVSLGFLHLLRTGPSK
jgi:hypothetical protein